MIRPKLSPEGERACAELREQIISGKYWAAGCPYDKHLPSPPPPPPTVAHDTPAGIVHLAKVIPLRPVRPRCTPRRRWH